MLRVNLIAVGRLKERFWADACGEYLKRLSRYVKLAVIEVPDCDPTANGGAAAARELETRGILKHLQASAAQTVLFDRSGKQLSSEELAELLSELAVAGTSSLNLIIGGSTGVEHALLPGSTRRISFGRITLPHNLARVVCLEQLYRACKINAGEPYHK